MKVIINRLVLRNMFKVRIFHGLSQFYRKFIKNFNSLCAPIVETIKENNKPFKWTIVADYNFKLLKKIITKLPALSLPDFGKVIQVETDANKIVIGVVLSQDGRPITYLSEKLNEIKQKYSAYDMSSTLL